VQRWHSATHVSSPLHYRAHYSDSLLLLLLWCSRQDSSPPLRQAAVKDPPSHPFTQSEVGSNFSAAVVAARRDHLLYPSPTSTPNVKKLFYSISAQPPPLSGLRENLKKHFGFTSFAEGQEEVITALLSGRDTLAVMPTGGTQRGT